MRCYSSSLPEPLSESSLEDSLELLLDPLPESPLELALGVCGKGLLGFFFCAKDAAAVSFVLPLEGLAIFF